MKAIFDVSSEQRLGYAVHLHILVSVIVVCCFDCVIVALVTCLSRLTQTCPSLPHDEF